MSVARHLGAGIALVAVVAGAFWGIGQLRTDEPGDPVIEAADTETTPPSTPAQTGPSVAPTETESTPAAPTTSPPGSPIPSETPSPSPQPDVGSEPPATETEEPSPRFSPSEISIQVLDAAADGGGRAEAAASQLRADGYDVVAVNRAVREYTTSTLMYSPGHEAEARQLARAYPEFTTVEPKPDNLSDSVDVHVVIGSDYPR